MLIHKIVCHKAVITMALKQKKKLARCFVIWQMIVHARRKRKVEKMLANKVRLVHLMRRWKRSFGWTRKLRYLDRMAGEFATKRMLKKTIRGLVWSKERRKFEVNAVRLVRMKNALRLRATAYHGWRMAAVTAISRREREAIEVGERRTRFFGRWVKYCQHEKRWRFLKQLAERKHREVAERRLMTEILRTMKRLGTSRKRREALGKRIALGHSARLCRLTLVGLGAEVVQQGYRKYRAAIQEAGKINGEVEQLRNRIDRTEKSRADLSDQVQDEKIRLVSDQDKLARKSDDVAELDRNVSTLVSQHATLNDEIKSLAARNYTEGERAHDADEEVSRAKAEYTMKAERMRAEGEKLRRRMKELAAQAKLKIEARQNAEEELRRAKTRSASENLKYEQDMGNAKGVQEQLTRAVETKIREIEGAKQRIKEEIEKGQKLKDWVLEVKQKADDLLNDKDEKIGLLAEVVSLARSLPQVEQGTGKSGGRSVRESRKDGPRLDGAKATGATDIRNLR